jgi:hypothetical protein
VAVYLTCPTKGDSETAEKVFLYPRFPLFLKEIKRDLILENPPKYPFSREEKDFFGTLRR